MGAAVCHIMYTAAENRLHHILLFEQLISTMMSSCLKMTLKHNQLCSRAMSEFLVQSIGWSGCAILGASSKKTQG